MRVVGQPEIQTVSFDVLVDTEVIPAPGAGLRIVLIAVGGTVETTSTSTPARLRTGSPTGAIVWQVMPSGARPFYDGGDRGGNIGECADGDSLWIDVSGVGAVQHVINLSYRIEPA